MISLRAERFEKQILFQSRGSGIDTERYVHLFVFRKSEIETAAFQGRNTDLILYGL
jgi:hypothetical protein